MLGSDKKKQRGHQLQEHWVQRSMNKYVLSSSTRLVASVEVPFIDHRVCISQQSYEDLTPDYFTAYTPP